MSFLEYTPAKQEEYLSIITQFYRDSSTIAELVKFIGEQTDYLHGIDRELFDLLNVDAMTGVNLDVLGRIVGAARDGATDSGYRSRIKLALSIQSNGTPEEIIASVKAITGASSVIYVPEYPAGFWVIPNSGSEHLTQEELNKIAPAGVQAMLPCFLVDARGAAIVDAYNDYILVVGPCDGGAEPEDYLVLDAGTGDASFTVDDLTIDGEIGSGASPEVTYDYAGGIP